MLKDRNELSFFPKETFLPGASLAWLTVGALSAHMPRAWKIFEQAVEQRFYTAAEVTFAQVSCRILWETQKKDRIRV